MSLEKVDRLGVGLGSDGRPPRVSRTCGTCRVCCVRPEIPELGKAMDAPCVYLNPDTGSEHGCMVFGQQSRPRVCGGFSCAWLMGLGEEDDRPDKLGVLMQPTLREGAWVLAFVEDRPGALRSERAQWLLGAWAAHCDQQGGDSWLIIRKHEAKVFMRVPVTVNGIVVRAGAGQTSTVVRSGE
jgi:hypothetical protein